MRLFYVWRGLDEWRAESATIELGDDGLDARGVQIGREHRLRYELRTDAQLTTQALLARVHTPAGERSLELVRDADGGWRANGEPQPDVEGALDCDLALSPLTNFMPARRLGGKAADPCGVGVVPDLEVLRSEQRYEPVRPGRSASSGSRTASPPSSSSTSTASWFATRGWPSAPRVKDAPPAASARSCGRRRQKALDLVPSDPLCVELEPDPASLPEVGRNEEAIGMLGRQLGIAAGRPLAVKGEPAIAVVVLEVPGEAPATHGEADVLIALGLDVRQSSAEGHDPLSHHPRQAILDSRVKRYHLTTFGCQMNEHDSERMKGMLESLGYSEVETRDAADLILFNTCSIREKADNRLVGHLGEAKRLKGEDPERVVGIGGCWSQSMKERVFEQFPFVDVAFGPGQVHKLAEFLTSDSLTAQGFFEFEGFTGHLPMKREREFQAWVQISVAATARAATA